MSKEVNILRHTAEIKNLNDLRMQKLRLKMGLDFLEDRLGANLDEAKYKLSPQNLISEAIQKVLPDDKEKDPADHSVSFLGVITEVLLTLVKRML